MDISICSFSFHRLLDAGEQDFAGYVRDSKALGATMLAPWNAHLAGPGAGLPEEPPAALGAPFPEWAIPPDEGHVATLKKIAEEAELPFEMLCVDQAHVFDEDPEVRAFRRKLAHRWLEIAAELGARSVRLDAGGPEEMPPEVLEIIAAGYEELIARGEKLGVAIVTENHWGPTRFPKNVLRLLDRVPGLGLLFDTNNWAPGTREEGWKTCAPRAAATHVKSFNLGGEGEKSRQEREDLARVVTMLVGSGYHGCWGVESVPTDGHERAGARETIRLIREVAKG